MPGAKRFEDLLMWQRARQLDFDQATKLCDETARLIQGFAKSMKSAARGSFRHRKAQIPWRERVEQTMKEITEGTKRQED